MKCSSCLSPIRFAFGAVALSLLLTLLPMADVSAREGTEWSTVYWYNANDEKLPRVLLIGDSIVRGYEGAVRNELAGTAYVGFWATSKSVTDLYYLKELGPILEAYDYKIIHFNNGLHSLGEDPQTWEKGLRATIEFLKAHGKGAKIVWATSTPLNDPTRADRVEALNQAAARVMAENQIPCDDLFALMNPLDRAVYWSDKYHYKPEGVQLEAKQVADTIRGQLGVGKASSADAQATLKAAASETGPDGKIDPARTAQQELRPLVNPRFENNAQGWSLYSRNGQLGSMEVVPQGPQGKPAVKITVAQPGLQFYQGKPAFEPNTTCVVSFWAKADAPVTLSAFVRTAAPPYQLYGGNPVLTIQGDWKKYDTKIAFPADYNREACNFFFDFKTPGTCWLADLSVKRE